MIAGEKACSLVPPASNFFSAAGLKAVVSCPHGIVGRRRPALDDDFVGFGRLNSTYRDWECYAAMGHLPTNRDSSSASRPC